jgi:glycine/D-amino acid oxidase-like deaminating enzyme/nitrite reductase/ring-hydroxylating ferredoxin subunit
VVGAGLTGVTTALLLGKMGIDVAVLEADAVGRGTSGRTTAKITLQHGLCYQRLSEQRAQCYASANAAGASLIESLIGEYQIACDYEKLPAYVYTRDENQIGRLEKELAAYQKLGLKGRIDSGAGLPFPVRAALEMADQAQFHPLKYLYALARAASSAGVSIFERTRVLGLDLVERCTLHTPGGDVVAGTVVFATNYPLIEFPGHFFLRLHQERSYILSTDAGGVRLRGMYISAENPVHSVRTHSGGGKTQLLLGGFGHRAGKEDDAPDSYGELEEFLRTDFAAASPDPGFEWSAQDCQPLDGMPYVGAAHADAPRVYIAAGYDKWGMTNSAAAAAMICDSIAGTTRIDKEVAEAFSPLRFKPGASAKNFFVQAGETIGALTGGYACMPSGSYGSVGPGEGAVMRVHGDVQAVYRNEGGKLFAYQGSCTHLGCPLEYNAAEKSFDCRCHGSRFGVDGQVLSGPAKKPLARVDVREE